MPRVPSTIYMHHPQYYLHLCTRIHRLVQDILLPVAKNKMVLSPFHVQKLSGLVVESYINTSNRMMASIQMRATGYVVY